MLMLILHDLAWKQELGNINTNIVSNSHGIVELNG